ncbi:uncharacterized protein LOC144772901 isoform X2 [Lissotriton helveticus]
MVVLCMAPTCPGVSWMSAVFCQSRRWRAKTAACYTINSESKLNGLRKRETPLRAKRMGALQRGTPYSSPSWTWDGERETVRPRPRPMKRHKYGLLNSFVPLDILSDCREQVFVWGNQLRRDSEAALGSIMPATLRLIREHWIVFILLVFLLLAAIVYIIAATAYRVAKEQERLTILSLQKDLWIERLHVKDMAALLQEKERECRKWSLEQDMERRIQENEDFPASVLSMPLTPPGAGGDEAAVDHALYKAGARVLLSMSSPALVAHQSWIEWLGSLFRDWHEADRYHRLMQEPDMTPGNCFPMEGERGLVTLKLNSSVVVSTVGLDHLSRFILRNITLAPRDFIVYCFDEAFSWARKLGAFRYEIDGEPSQTFRVQHFPW